VVKRKMEYGFWMVFEKMECGFWMAALRKAFDSWIVIEKMGSSMVVGKGTAMVVMKKMENGFWQGLMKKMLRVPVSQRHFLWNLLLS